MVSCCFFFYFSQVFFFSHIRINIKKIKKFHFYGIALLIINELQKWKCEKPHLDFFP